MSFSKTTALLHPFTFFYETFQTISHLFSAANRKGKLTRAVKVEHSMYVSLLNVQHFYTVPLAILAFKANRTTKQNISLVSTFSFTSKFPHGEISCIERQRRVKSGIHLCPSHVAIIMTIVTVSMLQSFVESTILSTLIINTN